LGLKNVRIVGSSLISIKKEISLGKNIVFTGKCIDCAACVVACSIGCLDYVENKPKIKKECKTCGICSQVCPRYNLPWHSLEEFVFGQRSRPEEDFGIYKRIVIAQATDENVLRVCQDGGVTSMLLIHAVKNDEIDGAAISGISKEKPLYPMPKLAASRGEILKCAGTRYFYSPNLLGLGQLQNL
jgi:coenzyme F420 hydrogenase subunit beta